MREYDLSSPGAIAAAAVEVEKERLRLHEVGAETGHYDTRKSAYLDAYGQALKDCAKQLKPMQRLVDTILNYLGDHYDSSDLYRMMHDDMGLSQDDIEFLGFDLSECYEDLSDMVVESWEDMNKKYPTYREDMTVEQEEAWVTDCYKLYEQEGFSPKYWSPFTDNQERIGLDIEIVGRVQADLSHDLSVLPMWKARFADGSEFEVFPEEIIPSEMKANGCNWFAEFLLYDRDIGVRLEGFPVDVMTPQEMADMFGKAVKDGNRFYLPVDIVPEVGEVIRDAESQARFSRLSGLEDRELDRKLLEEEKD